MNQPSTPVENERNSKGAAWGSFGFILLLVSAVLPLCLFSMIIWPSRGNDFGGGGMAIAAIALLFMFVSPATMAMGLILVRKFSESKFQHVVGWISSVPTMIALVFLTFGFVYEMRPIPKYNPKDYQHLIGKHLRDARSELDTRNTVSGSESGGGTSFRFLSFRGMQINANRDGIIFEVNKGLRN